ncbi:MAG: hypothetical protein RMY16_15580 [Nostoc sp. DedQUE12b]|nr:hypothetical protein [Nostoc sp. DedQUE12b]MDZ8086959.1 hypothetical protein [Nostoc sp. DedQUE12b]
MNQKMDLRLQTLNLGILFALVATHLNVEPLELQLVRSLQVNIILHSG